MSTSAATTTKTFADFGVDAEICQSLADVGIVHPFPIQELTLPLALSGADIIGQARTGTGKTLGFGLPMLQRLSLDGGLQVLIVVPTRELCMQVAEDLAQAGARRGVKVTALYGGKAMQPQIDALEAGAHVVVGTPGRLLDLSRRGHLNLSGCRGLVLDEADEMLDLGFLPDVEALVEQCAEDRQTLLFSATMPAQIVGLARRYMRKPTFMRADVEEVHIGPQTRQHFFSCHRMDKPAVLARILQSPNRGLCVVFCRTKRMADQLSEELRERDVAAQAIHSDLRQEARERALEKFRQGKTTVLCATEVAARGLDIDDVTHVVNYDCPDDEKMYLHRIGRTGRAGADGVAITFALWNELPRLEMIRRELDIEEEIHEVFSTSPLLDELFDLPAREEKRKVASPPKARTGKPSRTARRAETAEPTTGEKAGAAASERASGGRPTGRSDGRTSDAPADRSRTRTRTRGEAGARTGRPAPVTEEGGDVEAPAATTGASDSASDSDSDATTRRRTRTRTASGRRPAADAGSAAASDDAAVEDRAADGRRSGRTSERTADTAKPERSRQGRSRSEKDGRGESSRGESSRGSDDDGGKARRSSRSSGSRGKSNRGNKDDSRSSGRRERSGGRERPVDADEARGDGTPRLRRKMEVTHLP